jgi:hypothetical protein
LIDFSPIDRLLICGGTGSGKSNTAFVMVEALRSKGYPVVVIDHYSEFAEAPGLEVIRAADYAPLTLAAELDRLNASVAISMSGVDKTRWVADFIRGALSVKRSAPVMVVIDEAHNYAPQRDLAPPSRAWVNNLCAEGRKLGYGFCLISQRMAKLDKDSASQADTWIIHRHIVHADTQSLREFIGKNADGLSTLPVGEAIVMQGGGFKRVQFPKAKLKTIGSTPTPKSVKAVSVAASVAPTETYEYQQYQPGIQQAGYPGIPGVNAPAPSTDNLMLYVGLAAVVVAVVAVVGLWYYNRAVKPGYELDAPAPVRYAYEQN